MTKMIRLAVVALATTPVFAMAQFTLATHDNPSTNASTAPVITFNTATNTLSGSWTSTGLTLETPGLLGGGVVNNARMIMSPLTMVNVTGNLWQSTGGGTITYTTAGGANVLTATFNRLTFFNNGFAGASSLNGDGVTFSGPNVPAGLSSQSINFALAGGVTVGNERRFTAAMDSSAVPEPATMIALGAAVAGLAARRRRK